MCWVGGIFAGVGRATGYSQSRSGVVHTIAVLQMNESIRKSGRRTGLIVTASIVAGLLLCGGLNVVLDWPKNGILVWRLEADLNEKLPEGSTWEQAEAWFASHSIQSVVFLERNTDRKIGLGATIPNDSLFGGAEIRIRLDFNPEGRLEKKAIYRWVPSL